MTTRSNELKDFRCGMVSIIGRPNVGKSTLLNAILKEKVAIVTKVPQTTRHQIRGVHNDDKGQIIFIDTPGIHLGADKLDKYMNQASTGTLLEADCLIYLVDTTKKTGEEEENIAKRLQTVKKPIILGLNKVDINKGENIPEYISLWERAAGKPVTEMTAFTMLPLSAKNNTNIGKLIDVLYEYLPVGPALYPRDTVCDIPRKLVIADTIREKLFELMKEEVPHSLGVVVEHMQPKRHKTLYVRAVILTERDTQKEIVIGKKGAVLKKVGTAARQELEDLLETKIFLELFVKVQKGWRDDASILQELGHYYE